MQETNRVKNPGKQRKMLFNAPAHLRHKQMGAPLSSELTASNGAKTLPVRKGDTVRILRGDNKGFEGKVSRVDLKAYRIYMEGLTREKVDGTNIFIAVHPSKVQIRKLNLDDKYRKETILGRKVVSEKKEKSKAKTAKATKAPVKTAKEEKPVKEAAPAEESEEKKPAAKKAAKETEEKETAPKARAKKASEKGGE
jgi:large subunit ribosomal protein L24